MIEIVIGGVCIAIEDVFGIAIGLYIMTGLYYLKDSITQMLLVSA